MNRFRRSLMVFLLVLVQAGAGWSASADIAVVQLQTNYGDITLELYPDDAPVTVANFLGYVESGFYEGLIFHRVIDDFMIQAGVYDEDLYDFLATEPSFEDPEWATDPEYYHEPGDPIVNEADNGLLNERGTIAMARTSLPDSATSQFFINYVDNPSLDPGTGSDGYAVFGRVIAGMAVVDQIAQSPTHYVNETLKDLPDDAVVIEGAQVLQRFETDSSADFGGAAFLNGADGTLRTYVGQAGYDGQTYRHVFTEVTHLGIAALEWAQVLEEGVSEGVDGFSIIMARDTAGVSRVYRYVLNEGENDEQVVIEAGSLAEGVTFAEMADSYMHFRIITGGYNPTELGDALNTITTGSGADQVTEQIVDLGASLEPRFGGGDLIVVRRAVGQAPDESEVRFQYYHADYGMVLDLWDAGQDTAGDGYLLAPMNFDATSNDLSTVAFLHVPNSASEVTRTFVGQGAYEGTNYTHTFEADAGAVQGVDYVRWRQEAVAEAGIEAFTLNVAKDVEGRLWVFYYAVDGETVVEVETLVEAVELADLADENLYFRMITGRTNPDDVGDAANTVVTGAGETQQTEQIVSFGETLSFIPHYQGELVEAKRWTGPEENGDDIGYYHESLGLIVNQRNGETASDGDGWRLAFYGGTFDDETSFDFSDVPFVNATDGDVRVYVGQGDFAGMFYEQAFDKHTFLGVDWLKWAQGRHTDGEIDPFYIYMARDSLGAIWVSQYYVNNVRIFRAASVHEAKLLSEFDDNMLFRLVSGLYNSGDLGDAANRFSVEADEVTTSYEISSFGKGLDAYPYYGSDVVQVRRSSDAEGSGVDWLYYDASVGLAIELLDTSEEAAAGNYFDAAGSVLDYELNGWRLGWYGEARPSFDRGSSADFSEVPFAGARPGDVRFYSGQAGLDGGSYLVTYGVEPIVTRSDEPLLYDTGFAAYAGDPNYGGVSALIIEENADGAGLRDSRGYAVARDTDENLWLLRTFVEGETTFEAGYLDQVVPFSRSEDFWLLLMNGDADTDIVLMDETGAVAQTEQVVAVDASLDAFEAFEDFEEELLLTRWHSGSVDEPLDVRWSYWHESVGRVLELWPGWAQEGEGELSTDPELIDTEGDGWLLVEADAFDDLPTIKVRPGKELNAADDYFRLAGRCSAESEDFEAGEVVLRVGPCLYRFDAGAFGSTASGRVFRYQGGAQEGAGRFTLLFDVRSGKFVVIGREVDLTGLAEPVAVDLLIGDSYSTAGAAEVVGARSLPVEFLVGQADALGWTSFRHSSNNGPNGASSYSLQVVGEIATQVHPVDLAGKEVTITWGTSTFTIPSAEDGGRSLRRVGRRNRFVYSDRWERLRSACFDFDKGTFRFFVAKGTSLSAPASYSPVNLTITFETQPESYFAETVAVP